MNDQIFAPDAELRVILNITRRLPKVRGAGLIAKGLRRIYLRRPRGTIAADVLGLTMRLEPKEWCDAAILLFPHRFEPAAVQFMLDNLRRGGVFLDIGANVGFFALLAARKVGPGGFVVAIEADPYTHQKLCANIRLNSFENVRAVHAGVSDKKEILRLGIHAGDRGSNSFLQEDGAGVEVECAPLLEILQRAGIQRVDGLKMDIEGFEFRVLQQFLKDAPPALLPKFAIIEANPEYKSSGDAIALMQTFGYKIRSARDLNYLLAR